MLFLYFSLPIDIDPDYAAIQFIILLGTAVDYNTLLVDVTNRA